jgi:hypothetical protein
VRSEVSEDGDVAGLVSNARIHGGILWLEDLRSIHGRPALSSEPPARGHYTRVVPTDRKPHQLPAVALLGIQHLQVHLGRSHGSIIRRHLAPYSSNRCSTRLIRIAVFGKSRRSSTWKRDAA